MTTNEMLSAHSTRVKRIISKLPLHHFSCVLAFLAVGWYARRGIFGGRPMTEREPTDTFHGPRADFPSTFSTPLGTGETPSAGVASPFAADQPPDEFLPRPFGRYELRRLLGRGG